MTHLPRSLVVNFNSPELNYLALTLARRGMLTRYVRPYVNKGRRWERALESLPMLGPAYASTFGRRRIDAPELTSLTCEAGVLADIGVATIGRLRALPSALRQHGSYRLQEVLRRDVARAAARHTDGADCIVAYIGCGLPAFIAMGARGHGNAVVSYPIAHHRQHREVQREEREREPEFAATWPTLDDWPTEYEEQVDLEIELAERILVGSSYVRESFIAQGVAPAKVAVAPYGVDLATFAPGTRRNGDPDRFKAIFVGQLTQRKGISYLLRAYRRFRKSDTELTLVGNAPETAAPLRPYAELFRHIRHQTRPALAELYRSSDVFVFPTLLEGMGLVVLEAMACGLPVIVTANGPGDIVRDGVDGFVVPSRDEDALVDRLERLYRDPEMRMAMGRSACARATEFTWTAYADRVLAVLTDVAGPLAVQRSAVR